jgi:hypothetical protein
MNFTIFSFSNNCLYFNHCNNSKYTLYRIFNINNIAIKLFYFLKFLIKTLTISSFKIAFEVSLKKYLSVIKTKKHLIEFL